MVTGLGESAIALGCDPTGAVDGLATINAALALLAGSASVLFFDAGTFKVSAAITNAGNVPILLGKGATFTGAGAASITQVAYAWPAPAAGVAPSGGGYAVVGVVGAGDSHTNGEVAIANSTSPFAGSPVGTYTWNSPWDRQWTGTAENAYCRADSQINVTTGSTDPNVGVSVNNGSYLMWVPPMLRAAAPGAIQKIRYANVGVGGASSYSWGGECANGYVAGLLAPLDGDTVTIAGQVYTFRTAPAVAYDVLIGTATGSIQNLANAVNAEGTGFFATGTLVNANAFAPNPTATTYGHFFALLSGTAGNSLTIAASNLLRVTAVNASLVPVASVNMTNGSATSALYTNAKTALNGGAGFGNPSVFLWTLGTNDATRPGYRGRGTQTEMANIINHCLADYPLAKHVIWKAPSNSVAATQTALTNTVNPAMAATVAAFPASVSIVDMATPGVGAGDCILQAADGVHLTPYGYTLAAQLYSRATAVWLGLSN